MASRPVRMAPGPGTDHRAGLTYIALLTGLSARLWLSCVCFGFRSGVSARRRQGRTVAWTAHADDFSCCDRSLALTEQTSAEEEPDLKLNDELHHDYGPSLRCG